MNRRSLALLAAAALLMACPAMAAPDDYAVIQQVAVAHAHIWARLKPQDRRLLGALADRLYDALPPNAQLPQVAGRLIAKAARGRLSSDQVAVLADDASAALSLRGARMTDMPKDFSIDYLQLQATLQDENRAYALVSNIMKTKHDTVKNTISNIR
jgi:hypothetical protein